MIRKGLKMSIFDKFTSEKTDIFEEQLREMKAEKVRIIRQIGEMFVSENNNKDMSNTSYAELFDQLKNNSTKTILIESQQLASKGLRKCDSCGAELPIDSMFCNKCGAKQPELETEILSASKKCPNCGADIEGGDAFCLKCGHKL